MRYLLLFLIIVPALEIGLFILSGKAFGIFPTIGLIVLTGVIGAYLAKTQGIKTLKKFQEQTQLGNIPGAEIVDGLCILVGGIFLITPGFISDLAGLFLLLPPTRTLLKPFLLKLIKKWIDRKNVIIYR